MNANDTHSKSPSYVLLYAHRSVKFEEDVVSCSGSDGPEEVLPQVRLLQRVTLIHLCDTKHTFSSTLIPDCEVWRLNVLLFYSYSLR